MGVSRSCGAVFFGPWGIFIFKWLRITMTRFGRRNINCARQSARRRRMVGRIIGWGGGGGGGGGFSGGGGSFGGGGASGSW